MLTQYIGDSKTYEVDLTWEGSPFTPGETWGLIATFKRKPADTDAEAVFQKASGAGITVAGSAATLEIVPADTSAITATTTLVCDIQAQHVTTGEIRTVYEDKLKLRRDITRETSTSVPVNTTEEAVPFAGSVTSTNVLAALASLSAEEITALRAILADASVMLAPLPE